MRNSFDVCLVLEQNRYLNEEALGLGGQGFTCWYISHDFIKEVELTEDNTWMFHKYIYS